MSSMDFKSLKLEASLLHNLSELGFTTMTPIQAESLPPILEGRDVIAQAKTGSGKTAAFGLGLLSKLKIKEYKVQSLVLCPTRELADQVAKELRRLARTIHNIKILTLTGGMPFGPQIGSLRHQAHIIVGTPGRVLKHLQKENLSLAALETLVLDEADRMLDMGFIEEIEAVIAFAPKARQTLLFSATYPQQIISLSFAIQRDAVTIKTIEHDAKNQIEEYFYEVCAEEKAETVVKLLAHYRPQTAIVFTNTKIAAQKLAEDLHDKGIDALAIHGDLEQYERIDVLVQFANRSCSVLVATDVAARGIDIKELGMVINYELPNDQDTYVHRIGRTGRAGERGLAFTLISSHDEDEAFEYKNENRIFAKPDDLKDAYDFTMRPPNRTLIIEGGKKDKVRPGDILGALTGDAGIEGKYVGKIDIYDKQSYVAIDADKAKEAQKRLQGGNIKGRRFPVWIIG